MKAILPYIAIAASMYDTAFGSKFDNSQHSVIKHCKKCGKEFKTKAQGGYINCRECN